MVELMLSEFGIWDKALGSRAGMSDFLIDSYIRRRRHEWEQQAVHIVNALSKAMASGDKKSSGDPFRALERLGVKVPSE